MIDASWFPTAAGMTALLISSLEAAVVLGAAWLGTTWLRQGSAAARHQLWALGVAGALALPALSWALPALPSGWTAPAIEAGRPLVEVAVRLVGAPAAAGPSWPAWVALAWAAGALFVAVRTLRGHLAADRLWRAAQPARAEAWGTAAREAADALGVAGPVPLGRSATITSPMTLGALRPRVLLPAAADDWSPQRLRAVLLHELGHVKRRDNGVQLSAQLACAVYWWNPLAWLAASRLRLEREQAADDLVLGAGVLPSSYATELLELARSSGRGEPAWAGAVGLIDPSGTEARLLRILDPSTRRGPAGAGFRRGARVGAASLVLALACAPDAGEAADDAGAASVTSSPSGGVARVEALPAGWGLGPLSIEALEDDAQRNERIQAELAPVLAEVQGCYEQRLATRPGLAGTIVAHASLDASGMVEEACVTSDTLKDEGVLACFNERLRAARFTPPVGDLGREISVSFTVGATTVSP